ncbi:MAG: glycoside hydrolase family 13 protein [Bacteroidetes bacterium]|nr:glycoside hydrolase family 13 protein [Bacteroidota bacterium]
MKKTILIIILFIANILLFAQDISLSRVEPPFWWTGFKNRQLQLMIYGKNISQATVSIKSPDVALVRVNKVENPDYLFLDLLIQPLNRRTNIMITFINKGKQVAGCHYELRMRKAGSADRVGFNANDVVYLLMPDRFANGDTTNDNLPGMFETTDRNNPDGRHGGDIKGIMDHLGYIQDLGATAIWINPLLENNMKKYSYHGYSTTDYYNIDARFGRNEDYIRLSDSIHKKGMKLIMDMIFNHCGLEHWWMKALPSPDWLNNWPEFTRTSYRAGTMVDPYLSAYDSRQFVKGWFDQTMPDLNQHNPYLAKYLIQNSIWWIEYAGLDGIRQDTYPYCYKDFMADWDKAVLKEYPRFNIVGECWVTNPAGVAYWQKDAKNRDHYNSFLPSVFDFPMYDALRLGFMEDDGWNTGILRLYDILSQDLSYPDPSHIVIFSDNHDVNRYFDSQKDDIRKVKMGLAFVLTTRGIPEIYYGTEILMTTGDDQGDGQKRKDFPGGWPKDLHNAFTASGRDAPQNDMFQYLHNLLNWRKNKEVIHSGKLKQFVPNDGLYVYFRYNQHDTVMVVMNNNKYETKVVNRNVCNEFLKNFHRGKEIISGSEITDPDHLSVAPKSVMIIEFKH